MALDWLNVAGGAAKGYVQGDEDNRRREEFNTLQRQRLRVEKEQKLDDEIAAELKNVRPAGKYQDVVERTGALEGAVEKHPEFVGPGSGALRKEVKVSAADADRQRADIMARRGNLQSLQAATALRQGAHQTEQAERAESRAQTEDVFLKAGQMRALGNHVGAMRHLAQAYDKVPDGHKLEVTDVDGVPHVGVVGPSGQYVEKPVPVTAEVVDKMIARGIEMTSVQAQQKGRELGIHQQTADSGRISAEAATKNAEANYKKAMFEAGDDAQKQREADIAYKQALSKAALINANANATEAGARANAVKKQTPAEKVAELTEFYTPLIMQANPGMPIEQARKQAAAAALKDPNGRTAPVAIAGTDMIFDPGTQKIYRPGKEGELEEVFKPGDLKQVAANIKGNLPPKGPAAAGGTAAAAAPPPDTDGSGAAIQKVEAAEKALQKFGLSQRKSDPAGFAAATKARDAARAELAALNGKYADTQQTGAAFNTARP